MAGNRSKLTFVELGLQLAQTFQLAVFVGFAYDAIVLLHEARRQAYVVGGERVRWSEEAAPHLSRLL